jgi:hypothetical protein
MLLRAGAAAFILSSLTLANAYAGECGREAFAGVVSEASASLSAMNEAQKQAFQTKLQLLKSQKGWSEADYLANARPFIQDERIAAMDAETKALLAKVSELGASGQPSPALAGVVASIGPSADQYCAMLAQLRGLMAKVVESNRVKWAYMIGKVDAALDGARQAKAGR